MSVELDIAKINYERADRLVSVGKVLCLAYFFIFSVVVIAQLWIVQSQQQAALDKSISDNQAQHSRTQAYVRCIAATLLLPLAQRSEESFERCGVDITAPPRSAEQQTPQSTVQAVPPESSRPTAPATQEPTTSSPPPPAAEGTQDNLVRDLVDEVLDIPTNLIDRLTP